MLGEASALGRTAYHLSQLRGGQEQSRASGQQVTAELPAIVGLKRAGTGMRGRELSVVLLSPLQQNPMKTAALNSYQSTMSLEQ